MLTAAVTKNIPNHCIPETKIYYWMLIQTSSSVMAEILGVYSNLMTGGIHWKARGRLPICHNLTFFAMSYSWDVISGNLSKSSAHFRWKGRCSPTTVGVRIAEWLPFRVISAVHCLDVQKLQNYDSQDHASIASHGQNHFTFCKTYN